MARIDDICGTGPGTAVAAGLSRRGLLRGGAGIGALAALGPVLAGCSSGAASGSSAGATLKIGMTAALTGAFAATAVQFTGYMKRVFDQANAAGGVNGHTFQLVLTDDGASGERALTNARKLVEQEGVFAMSTVGTANTTSILDYLTVRKVPLLFPAAYVSSVISPVRANTFALFALFEQQITAVVKWAFATKGPGTVAIVRANLAYLDESQTATETVAAAGGGKVLKTISTQYNQPEWGSTVIQLKSLKPDYLVVLTTAPDSGRLWKEMTLQGFRPGKATLGLSTIADTAFLDTAGTVSDDATFGAVPSTVVPSAPGADPIRALWPGNTLGLFGLEGALAAATIIEAVRQLDGKVTQPAILDLLADGFTPFKTSYSSTIAPSPDHLLTKQMGVATVRSGEFVPATTQLISA